MRSILLAPLLLVGATCRRDVAAPPPEVPVMSSAPSPATAELPEGLDLRLSDGDTPLAGESIARASTTPLTAAQRDGLLARLPALPSAPRADFALRAASKPPPRPGDTTSLPFPPPVSVPAPEVPTGAVRVLRHAPDGEVPVAAGVSLSFDRAMVPLGAREEVNRTVPARLDPQPANAAWRWVGTRTLQLAPDVRLPMATTYTLTVPVGTRAADGSTLTEAFAATFATPPVSVVGSAPWSDAVVSRTPVIAILADQAVDAAALAQVIEVRAGDRTVAVRVATPGEIEADEGARALLRDAPAGRGVAFVPTSPLPTDTKVTVTLPAGTPSAEGPRRTTSAWSTRFSTFGALRLTTSRCGWESACRPGWPLFLTFSNPLRDDVDLDALVSIEPAVPDGTFVLQGHELVFNGPTQARTTYTVRARGLVDTFGQTLAEPVSARFSVGDAEPLWPGLQAVGPDVQIPDPFAPPVARFVVTGHGSVRVRVFRVGPEHWPAWVEQASQYRQVPADVGQRLLDEVRPTAASRTVPVEVAVDLSPWLSEGAGQLAVVVDSGSGAPADRRSSVRMWVNATRLGLTAIADAADTLLVVHDLRTGQVLPGVQLSHGERVLGVTGPDGQLRTGPLPSAERQPLVARLGNDTTLISASGGAWPWGDFSPSPDGVPLVWHVYDDRGLYRPGETVHVKGWVRHVDLRKGGDLLAPDVPADTPLTWRATDATGNELASGTTTIDAWGGFAVDLKLGDTPNLGPATIQLLALGEGHGHSFDVREFRRPEFEVLARVETAAPHVVGDSVSVATEARYLAGGALPGAAVVWSVRNESTTWSPAGWDGWSFGSWEPPWWRPMWRGFDHDGGRGGHEAGPTLQHEGRTDPLGVHRLRVDLLGVRPVGPRTVTAEATVQDVNRQAWTSAASFLVHPSRVYVGAKPERSFVEAGDPVKVELVAVDLDGATVVGRPLQAALVRERTVWRRGTWLTEEAERLACDVVSAATAVRCSFQPAQGGTWNLVVRTTDNEGRPAETRRPIWVAGGERVAQGEGVPHEAITLVPDRDRAEPGTTVEILAQLPFEATEAVVTWQRAGVVHVERLEKPGRSAVLKVPVTLEHAPAITVQVDAFGLAPREGSDTPRPAYATGALRIEVPPSPRRLTVSVEPALRALAPGEATTVAVVVKDADGRPVPDAQVALAMVDEAVLALSGHEVPDPLGTFHPDRGAGTQVHHGRVQILLAEVAAKAAAVAPEAGVGGAREEGRGGLLMRKSAMMEMAADAAMPMMAPPSPPTESTGAAPSGPPIAVRSDFRADALWVPAARTDRNGRVVVEVKLPDSLTRYRLSAVAVDTNKGFGLGEVDVTVRLPLMLRPSPPRFLNFGDRAELPLVVQNQTDAPLVVDLAVRGSNIDLGGPAVGLRATIPANDRRELRVPMATIDAGRARFQAVVASGKASDAAMFDLPVWTPATSEATAVYGVLDGPSGTVAVGQKLAVPGDVWTQFGGLEIDLASTQLQALTDAFVYVLDYPYGCSEQVASRVLSTSALRDVLEAFRAPGLPDQATLEAAIGRDLEELARRQNGDGSWGWWRQGQRGDPMLTVHVVHALVRARDARFEVPPALLAQGLQAITNIDRMFDRWWSEDARNVVRAQALLVRALAGEDVGKAAVALYRSAGGTTKLPLEAQAWLLPSLHRAQAPEAAEILAHWNNRVTETAAAAHWTTSYVETDAVMLLASDRRTDAALLDALLQVRPTDDLLPKVVEGLLGHRTKGRWGSTQENAWVLLALQRYFRVAEAVTPDMLVRAWVGPALAGEHRFQGRSTERVHVEVPMATLHTAQTSDLVLAREGKGRAYWRLGLRYAPKDLDLDPVEAGFAVERTYKAVDDPADVRREVDGSWSIRAGARVRVTLTMVAPSQRNHVALVDPLPAGLEVLDPGLKTTGSLPPTPADEDPFARKGWWWGPWYDHENVRDERVEAFARMVPAGVWTYTYTARATTPGQFVVPPAKAEEMYHPETFGRSATERVSVLAP